MLVISGKLECVYFFVDLGTIHIHFIFGLYSVSPPSLPPRCAQSQLQHPSSLIRDGTRPWALGVQSSPLNHQESRWPILFDVSSQALQAFVFLRLQAPEREGSHMNALFLPTSLPLTFQQRAWCVTAWCLLNLDARREESLNHAPPSEFSEKQRINSSK